MPQLATNISIMYLICICQTFAATEHMDWVWTGWMQVDVMAFMGLPMLKSSDIHMHVEFICL